MRDHEIAKTAAANKAVPSQKPKGVDGKGGKNGIAKLSGATIVKKIGTKTKKNRGIDGEDNNISDDDDLDFSDTEKAIVDQASLQAAQDQAQQKTRDSLSG